jgi:hypothetical protein
MDPSVSIEASAMLSQDEREDAGPTTRSLLLRPGVSDHLPSFSRRDRESSTGGATPALVALSLRQSSCLFASAGN